MIILMTNGFLRMAPVNKYSIITFNKTKRVQSTITNKIKRKKKTK